MDFSSSSVLTTKLGIGRELFMGLGAQNQYENEARTDRTQVPAVHQGKTPNA
jgi:hypothetical protein